MGYDICGAEGVKMANVAKRHFGTNCLKNRQKSVENDRLRWVRTVVELKLSKWQQKCHFDNLPISRGRQALYGQISEQNACFGTTSEQDRNR